MRGLLKYLYDQIWRAAKNGGDRILGKTVGGQLHIIFNWQSEPVAWKILCWDAPLAGCWRFCWTNFRHAAMADGCFSLPAEGRSIVQRFAWHCSP